MSEFAVLGIIPEDKGTWFVEVEGKLVPARHARFVLKNPAKNMHRVVELGWVDDQRGNAYDAIRYWELGGGGTVTIPYALFESQLWIGVVTQFRVHMGGDVENAPRGYLKVGGTSRDENASEELAEEVGPKVAALNAPVQMEGNGVNMNSAVFWTAEANEGNSFHAVEVPDGYLERRGERELRFKEGLVAPEGGESIIRCRFVPWMDVVHGRDGLSIVGVARLIAHLCVKTGEPLIKNE